MIRINNIHIYDDTATLVAVGSGDFIIDELTASRLNVLRTTAGFELHAMWSTDAKSQVWSLNRDGEDVHFVTVPNSEEGSDEAVAKLVAKGWEHLHPDQPHPLPSSQHQDDHAVDATPTPFVPFDGEVATNEDTPTRNTHLDDVVWGGVDKCE